MHEHPFVAPDVRRCKLKESSYVATVYREWTRSFPRTGGVPNAISKDSTDWLDVRIGLVVEPSVIRP